MILRILSQHVLLCLDFSRESSTEIMNRNVSFIVIQVDTLMASIKLFPLKDITPLFVCGLGHVRDPQ
jgi:hypothetical protein